jgi:hypothetical protein
MSKKQPATCSNLRHTTVHALVLSSACLALWPSVAAAKAIPVELRQTERGWQLLRGGEPYFVRGAGGDGSLEQLAAAGANSVRTWGADDIDARLDAAHALGLSVTVGIWLGHERHGFDYSDEAQVRKQLEAARQTVLRYKDHPAVLLWGIGNEMEGFGEGDNPVIWKAVNDIAAMVKKLDPFHPTMTVTAELGGGRIDGVQKLCPAIDIHGINTYGGAPSVAERYRAGGATKPYVLTEFGPPGVWEIPKNDWGAPSEPTSTEKAAFYRRSYESGVTGAPGLALGSYVFTWGFKMEATPTWYGMFLPDGAPLGAVDVMTELWSGSPPRNLAPTVEPLVIEGDPQLDPGDEVRVRAVIADPEGSAIRVRWVLRRESGEYTTGGDFRPVPPEVEGAVLEGRANGARLRMPRVPGPYRLFLYAYDAAGRAATANVPLLVKGQIRTPMPFYVYQDGFEGMPWAPSGWMGSTDLLTLDGDHAVRRRGRHLGGRRLAAPRQQLGRPGRRLRSHRGDTSGAVGPRRIRRRKDQHRCGSPRPGQGVPGFWQDHRRGHSPREGVAALPDSPEEARPVEHQDGLRRVPQRAETRCYHLHRQHPLRPEVRMSEQFT